MPTLTPSTLRKTFEKALEEYVRSAIPEAYCGMLPLLAYHMGWEGQGAGVEAQGKRIRPLLLLMTALCGGGDWRKALPGAMAVELVHNFSLVHDDIQDRSELRRGRPTLWTMVGIAQAINAGDLLFNLAFGAVTQLSETYSAPVALRSARILSETCTRLTGGQFLDLSYEAQNAIHLADYWPMVAGKTAALLSCCAEMGAICAGMCEADVINFRTFGEKLGLAFQAWDDYLGIWGQSAATGKSATSDLLSGKKSLPVLFALERSGAFAERWRQGPIVQVDLASVTEMLTREGAQEFVLQTTEALTNEATQALERTTCGGDGCLLLKSLAVSLLRRQQ